MSMTTQDMIANAQLQAHFQAMQQGMNIKMEPHPQLLDSPHSHSSNSSSMKQCDKETPEYLAQLLKDRKQIQAFPNVFIHVERLLDEEINKVRGSLFHFTTNKEPLTLPEPVGPVVSMSEKLFVPAKEHPEFNFVGRILGPRGMTAKQLEQDTGCKIMVRGKGSMRDKKKEELNRGKPNWEHLSEELHVLITVEDTRNRSEIKLRRAVEEVKKLLVPAAEGEDELKKMQLMELAIINGTYRDSKPIIATSLHALHPQQMLAPRLAMPPQLRSPTPAGAPLIIAPRLSTATSLASGLMNGAPPPLVSPTDGHPGLMYPYDPYTFGATSPIFEYPAGLDQSTVGAVPKMRRPTTVQHPYGRVSLA